MGYQSEKNRYQRGSMHEPWERRTFSVYDNLVPSPNALRITNSSFDRLRNLHCDLLLGSYSNDNRSCHACLCFLHYGESLPHLEYHLKTGCRAPGYGGGSEIDVEIRIISVEVQHALHRCFNEMTRNTITDCHNAER